MPASPHTVAARRRSKIGVPVMQHPRFKKINAKNVAAGFSDTAYFTARTRSLHSEN